MTPDLEKITTAMTLDVPRVYRWNDMPSIVRVEDLNPGDLILSLRGHPLRTDYIESPADFNYNSKLHIVVGIDIDLSLNRIKVVVLEENGFTFLFSFRAHRDPEVSKLRARIAGLQDDN